MPDSPVDLINPNIGGIGRLLTATFPAVQLPHGMTTVIPATTPDIMDRYLAERILGFRAGEVVVMPGSESSLYDHDFETAKPYYYSVLLEDTDITAEYTVTERTAFFRFTFPEEARLIWKGARGRMAATGDCAIEGELEGRREGRYFFAAEFSEAFTVGATGDPGMTLEFGACPTILVKLGLSYLSADQARKNVASENSGWDFEAVRDAARGAWEKALAKVAVTGGSAEERVVFHTAMYRALQRMVDITEGGKYIGFDGLEHEAGAHPYHVNDWAWDTYRAMHSLQLLMDPQRQEHMLQSYVRMYEQSGWIPKFAGLRHDHGAMIGHHAAALFADTYFKGHQNFDVRKAYEGMKKNATEGTMLPFRAGAGTELEAIYREKGFFPALAAGEKESVEKVHPTELRQSVSVTLESCYDDWCIAQMARALGEKEDYEKYIRRAANYRNVFNPAVGFMAPKSADGKWVEGFDPVWGGGQGGRQWFTEGNAWTYTWHVQHDVAGLIELMGGREKFLAKLDQLFVESFGPDGNKYRYYAQFPDMTCLVGQFAQGNEPGFHIPYLYCYAGEPWKTQRRLRETMRLWFHAGPEGVPGDEDGGAMSSWYVLSAIGIYPVCPGRPYYVIGSPIFSETRLAREGGDFRIVAKDVSGKNKYIQSAELNGAPLNRPWFWHKDLVAGGSLVLRMGPRPNKAWGSAPDAAPPSMSDEIGQV